MVKKRNIFKPNLKQATPNLQATGSNPNQITPIAPKPNSLNAGVTDKLSSPDAPSQLNSILLTQDSSANNDREQSQNPSATTNKIDSINNDLIDQQQLETTESSTASVDPTKSCNIIELQQLQQSQQQLQVEKATQQAINDISNQKVQEAITQLTGQRFEPIKSLSLRSSVNKNVKLKDLLFFNPPMTKDQKRHKKSVVLAKKNELKKIRDDEQARSASDKHGCGGSATRDNDNSGSDTRDKQQPVRMTVDYDEPSLIPKVKMGAEGKLVLDESSTVINRKNTIKEKEAIIEDNEDIISRTNYDSFRRKPTNTSQTKWSVEDTKKFYHALTILGTDFSMMESLLFSGFRSRTELHKKFKREERVNKLKVDIALSNRISLNSEELEDLKEIFYDH